MGQLDFLVGQWRGEGWIEYGSERRTFAETENVQRKQDGLLLAIEGRGTSRVSDGGERIVHDALGVVFYDTAARKHMFHAYKSGNFVGSELKLADSGKGFQWGFQDPRSKGNIRFTMTLAAPDRWLEIGELSQDGAQWRKFFEMTLRRVP